MKIRLRFEKTGDMKYIGHLDLMRYFQKVMRRASVPIRYSQGFSPHQLMSFAAPLGVGLESVAEYLDFESEEIGDPNEVLLHMNQVQTEGIRINGITVLPETAKNAMSLVAAADYEVTAENAELPAEDLCAAFRAADTFFVEKKTKKSVTMLDMKELVYEFSGISNGYFLRLATGSEKNVKPELFLSALFERNGGSFDPSEWRILRTEIYAGSRENGFLPLLEKH